MLKIKFVGTSMKSEDYTYLPLPEKSVAYTIKHWNGKIFLSAIVSLIIGFLLFLYKRYVQNDGIFPFDRRLIIVGCILGFVLLLAHEVLHLLPYPNQSSGIIGIEGGTLFAVCSEPISRNVFLFSAILPSLLLGVLPLFVFCMTPASVVKINTLLWSVGCIGLATSCQDYVVILHTLCHVPSKSRIQLSNGELHYFTKE